MEKLSQISDKIWKEKIEPAILEKQMELADSSNPEDFTGENDNYNEAYSLILLENNINEYE